MGKGREIAGGGEQDVRERPIGVFDSGVGGLTVLAALSRILPKEHFLYLGDTARVPYGSKSPETVTGYALETADFFAAREVKAIVVACNTTSAMALPVLQGRYGFPIVGVVEPGARSAIRVTHSQRIGVIGTEATLASGAYSRALLAEAPGVEIFTRPCPLFVPLAEEGWLDNDVTAAVVSRYLASLKTSGIDTLILGCTHYPLLHGAISQFLGEGVEIVDSALETARELHGRLEAADLLRNVGSGSSSFFVTDVADRFCRLGERFYGDSVSSAVRVVLRNAGAFAALSGSR